MMEEFDNDSDPVSRQANLAYKLKCNMAQHVANGLLAVVPAGQLGAGMTISETNDVQAEYDENSVTVTGTSIVRIFREDEPTLADVPGSLEQWLKNNRLATSPQLVDCKRMDKPVAKMFEIYAQNGLSTTKVFLTPTPDGTFSVDIELADWIKKGIESVGFRLQE